MNTIHKSNLRVWFDLEPLRAGYDVIKQSDGSWKLNREYVRERVGRIAWEGINGERVMAYSGWTPDGLLEPKDCFTPYLVINGKYDLDSENPFYWPIINEYRAIFAEFNMEFIYVLFDNCQFYGQPKWACWGNNIQGKGDYFDDVKRAEAFTLQAVNHLGNFDNVLFEIINEGNYRGHGLEAVKAWHKVIFAALHNGGITADRVSVGAMLTQGEWDGDKWVRKLALQDHLKGVAKEVWGENPGKSVYLPVHNVTSKPSNQYPYGPMYAQTMDYWGGGGIPCRFVLSNDGCNDKDSAKSRDLWKAMCAATKVPIHPMTGRKVVFEFLSDSNDLEVKILGAKAMCEGIGYNRLVNYHRKEYVPEPIPLPEPEIPEPLPEPIIPPVIIIDDEGPKKPEVNLQGEWNNNKWLIIGGALLILAVLFKVAC